MDLISKYEKGYRYFCHWYQGNRNYGNQVKVFSRDQAVELITKWNGIENCGMSISTFVNGVPKLLYLPFDFDSSNLREAFDDAKKLYNMLVNMGYRASFHFSGRKGFHVLVPVKPDFYTKEQLRATQEFFSNILNLKTVDTQIFHDIRRIIRIPGTYHTKTGRLCEILVENDEGVNLDINKLSPPKSKRIDPTNFRIDNKTQKDGIYHDYPCIKKLVRDEEYWIQHHPRGRFEPTQIIRMSWVIELAHEGYTEEEILEEAEEIGWDDFNPNKTLYQIRHVMRNNYIHASCELLQNLGFCLPDCPYRTEWKPRKINNKK